MRFKFLIFAAAVLLLALFLHFRSSNIPEPDIFYHFRHADIYREKGIGIAGFPRISSSALGKYSADLWYGFHLILIPFTVMPDQILGIRIAGVFITASFLITLFWAFWRMKISNVFFWPFFVLFSAPPALYHFAMARPHVLSAALSALLFSFLMDASLPGVFFVSLLLNFFHLNFFWVPLTIFAVFAFFKFIFEKKIEWRVFLWSLAGLGLGWALRPSAFGALKLLYVQIVELALVKSAGFPLRFGNELLPLGFWQLKIFIPFLVLWLFAVVMLLLKRPKLSSIWTSAALSVVFFLMTVFVATRSFDLWTIFGGIFIALSFTSLISFKNKEGVFWVAAPILVFMLGYGIYSHGRSLEMAWNPLRYRPAAEWLKSNTLPGEILFNISWDQFPELFVWHPEGLYVSGMDPIFQYSFSPILYWKNYFLETGQATSFTCGKTICSEAEQEETYKVLKNDFNASYIFLSKPEDLNLYNYFRQDQRFNLRFEDAASAVFQVL